jgi:hypothetical protein
MALGRIGAWADAPSDCVPYQEINVLWKQHFLPPYYRYRPKKLETTQLRSNTTQS